MSDDDMAAYNRMRSRGLHPAQIKGCAAIEHTATRENLSWGVGMTEEQILSAREGISRAMEIDW